MGVRQRQQSGGQGARCMHQNSEWDRQAQTRTITKHKVAAFIYLFIYLLLPFGSGDGVISDKI